MFVAAAAAAGVAYHHRHWTSILKGLKMVSANTARVTAPSVQVGAVTPRVTAPSVRDGAVTRPLFALTIFKPFKMLVQWRWLYPPKTIYQ